MAVVAGEIKVLGQRFIIDEICSVMRAHEKVMDALLVAPQTAPSNALMVGFAAVGKDAFVLGKPHRRILKQLRHAIKERFGVMATPKIIVLLSDLPRDLSGQVSVAVLKLFLRKGLSIKLQDLAAEFPAGVLSNPEVLEELVYHFNPSERYRMVEKYTIDELEDKRFFAGDARTRLGGLKPALAETTGKTILDLGCCNGVVGREFLKNGAARYDGVDILQVALDEAKNTLSGYVQPKHFFPFDFTQGAEAFDRFAAEHLLPRYDTVLFLGVYQHLARQMEPLAIEALMRSFARLCGRRFILRMTPKFNLDPIFGAEGFVKSFQSKGKILQPVSYYDRVG